MVSIAGLTPLIVAAFLRPTPGLVSKRWRPARSSVVRQAIESRYIVFGGASYMPPDGWCRLCSCTGGVISGRLLTELLVILCLAPEVSYWVGARRNPSQHSGGRLCRMAATFAVPAFLSMFLLTATLFVGVASRYTDDHDREWWGRAGAWTLIVMLTWIAGGGWSYSGPDFCPTHRRSWPAWRRASGDLSGGWIQLQDRGDGEDEARPGGFGTRSGGSGAALCSLLVCLS